MPQHEMRGSFEATALTTDTRRWLEGKRDPDMATKGSVACVAFGAG